MAQAAKKIATKQEAQALIKSELVQKIAGANSHLLNKDVEAIVNTVLDTISDALVDGGRVELRGFGTFYVKVRDARVGRNPRTGEAVNVPAKSAVAFRPGKDMTDRLNKK